MKNVFLNNKMLLIGSIIILIYIIIAIFVPILNIKSPVEMSTDIFEVPGSEYFLGTNDIGQDIFSRILYGTKQTMFISIMVATISTSIALIFGSLAALKEGLSLIHI